MCIRDSINAVSMQNGFGGIPENTIEKLRNLIKVRGLDERETDEKKKNNAVARLKFLNLRGEKSYDKSRV